MDIFFRKEREVNIVDLSKAYKKEKIYNLLISRTGYVGLVTGTCLSDF